MPEDFYSDMIKMSSYLYCNENNETNVSPEIFAKFDMLVYYNDKHNEFNGDTLIFNDDGKFYPITNVKNSLLNNGIYVETKEYINNHHHYKISHIFFNEALDSYKWLFLLSSKKDVYPLYPQEDVKRLKERHCKESYAIYSQSCVISRHLLDKIKSQEEELNSSKKYVEYLKGNLNESYELLADSSRRAKRMTLDNMIFKDQQFEPSEYKPQFSPDDSVSFKEAASVVTTALGLVKLGLSVGKQLKT